MRPATPSWTPCWQYQYLRVSIGRQTFTSVGVQADASKEGDVRNDLGVLFAAIVHDSKSHQGWLDGAAE